MSLKIKLEVAAAASIIPNLLRYMDDVTRSVTSAASYPWRCHAIADCAISCVEAPICRPSFAYS